MLSPIKGPIEKYLKSENGRSGRPILRLFMKSRIKDTIEHPLGGL
jgi:hypothetical protein